ncbi:MAG TPA: hypothetical protein VFN71_13915 [Methylomirabilota bacterium]|nr:hypothetical protein [Methylomirabilota bacterium]
MMRTGRERLRVILVVAIWTLGTTAALAEEPVAVVTEIRAERGQVQVKRVGESEWRPTQPLLALRPGDQLRAAGEGRAVVVFTGGRGSQTVSAANSPLTVEAPKGQPASEKLRGVLGGVTDFLVGRQKPLDSLPLAVREVRPPRVAILSPRDTRLLPGPVVFEWSGSNTLPYRVHLSGPQGVLWEQANLPRKPLEYPAGAPALAPDVRYAWELEAPGHPAQRAEFEILRDGAARAIRGDLELLTPAGLPGYPASSVALMRAGFLFRERLHAQARRELLQAIAADPDEPTLHLLLGQVYERIGLRELATRELIEARDLSRGRP